MFMIIVLLNEFIGLPTHGLWGQICLPVKSTGKAPVEGLRDEPPDADDFCYIYDVKCKLMIIFV